MFFFTTVAPRLFAAEYSHIYKFEEPKIITLSNGLQIVEMQDTRQKDDIVGAPILPVKTSEIFIPVNEKVVSTEIEYGTLRSIEGSYLIQHVTTPHPTSHKGPVTVDKPAPDIYEAIHIDCSGNICAFTDFIQNISVGGLYIETQIPLFVDQELSMSFFLSDNETPIKNTGSIVRGDERGIGIQFGKPLVGV